MCIHNNNNKMAKKEENGYFSNNFISESEKDDVERKLAQRQEKQRFALKAGIFLAGVTIVSAVAGFSTTVSAVKKREHEVLAAAGFSEAKIADILTHEAGSRLAMRALGWGTLWAVTGVSLICYTGWKISGASNFEEFRLKVGTTLPKIPKSENPGRSEFSSVYDFLDYISQPAPKSPTPTEN